MLERHVNFLVLLECLKTSLNQYKIKFCMPQQIQKEEITERRIFSNIKRVQPKSITEHLASEPTSERLLSEHVLMPFTPCQPKYKKNKSRRSMINKFINANVCF
uniref:(northern house mosquito) hypothetical protein n=1 Tax=Culex pipiens TaxID=7175 RepID=A0A8D8AJ76_CULPI